MKFVDRAKLFVRSGKGGDGCLAFLREKYREFGGPSGGNGGKGGDILVKGAKGLYTLFDLNLNPHQSAENGFAGSGKNKHGRNGRDLTISLPLGTQIFVLETGEMICDVRDETPHMIVAGGKGGRGNNHFKSSINKAPRRFTKGIPSVEMVLSLQLKLIADAGLVGFPNAGKSTFISKVSSAHPKIADYPFTTLKPNLGTVKTDYFKSFVIADIPGIIEGASQGKGLGHYFLRHIERTKILTFLIDFSSSAEMDPIESYMILNRELGGYSPELLNKPQLILLSKCDHGSILEEDKEKEALDFFKQQNLPYVKMSSHTGEGVSEAINTLGEMVLGERVNVDLLFIPE